MAKLEYFDGGQWVGLSAPKTTVPITTGIDFTNGNQRGFRTGHLTNPTDTLGMFHLSTLDYTTDNENSHFVSTRILTFNQNNNDQFDFLKAVNFQATITADTQVTVNNADITATATGLITQKAGEDTAEFGFNNSTNEAYVWSKHSLKLGTGFTKRLEIAADSGKTSFYDSNIQVYIRPSSNRLDIRGANVRNSKASTIIETNAYNESAAIVMNGDYIQTIQTFDDLGFIFTDEDADPQTTYKSYISSTGSLVVSSTQANKFSLRKKAHKDYLQRLNQLNIYSYASKTPVFETDVDKVKLRKFYKNRQLHMGVIAEEVAQLFDNATDQLKLIEVDKTNRKEFKQLTDNFTPEIADVDYLAAKNDKPVGVNYQTLLCYTILALQELTHQVNQLEQMQ